MSRVVALPRFAAGVPVLLAFVWLLLGVGCGSGGGAGTSEVAGPAAYGELVTGSAGEVSRPRPARIPVPASLPTNAALTVIQTELFPATLWRSSESRVRVFADLASTGLGGPTFLAYSSPTGIATLRPGDVVNGSELRENWLLACFPGASGWTNWDSPWAVFLQRRPARVQFNTNGVELQFVGPAAHFAMMPLYGYYKPPQMDHEFKDPSVDGKSGKFMSRDSGSAGGMKRPKLLTWEWPLAVARDPLTRLRYWAGATRCFPVRCEDTLRVDQGRGSVTIRQRFDWLDIPDEWGTRPIRIAPVSPTLGLALKQGPRFPVEFSAAPFDFEIPTPYGPFHGVPDADGYDMTFPVLRYVNETEAAALPVSSNAPPIVVAALQRLRAVARERFPGTGRFQPDHGGPGNLSWSVMGDSWYAKALPYLDDVTRSNAVVVLRRYLREEVLVPGRFVEREFPAGSGLKYRILEGPGIGPWTTLDDAGKFSANLLETVWAYAHFTGDHALVRERWSLIRRLFTTAAQTRWVGFGRDQIAEPGDEASAALAFARLAYLAGDLDAYAFGCAEFARELVQLHVRQCGAPWFRAQQPWHSMEPIDTDVFLTNLWGDVAGWQMDGPRYPAATGGRQFENRWVRFQNLDVARFCREHLQAEVRSEFVALEGRWEPNRRFTDDSRMRPSWVRLESLLLGAAPERLATIATPDQFQGPPSGVVASCLAVLRAAQAPRFERLIPAGPPSAFVLGLERDVPGPNTHLVQSLSSGSEQTPGWPRITWWGWQTPSGQRWNFGEVQAGDVAAARLASATKIPLNWNSVRWDFVSTPSGAEPADATRRR